MERKKKITDSFLAKVIAFFLLAISAFGTIFSGFVTIYLVDNDFYTKDLTELFFEESKSTLWPVVYETWEYLKTQEEGYARALCEGRNYDIALLDAKGEDALNNEKNIVWTTYDGSYETDLTLDFSFNLSSEQSGYLFTINQHNIYSTSNCVFRVYVDTRFGARDELRNVYNICNFMDGIKYTILWVFGVSIFVLLNSFLFLMCSAGHRSGMEGIQPSVFTNIPLDLYSAAYGLAAVFLFILLEGFSYGIYDFLLQMILFCALAAALTLWCTFYFYELAIRMKLGRWWRNTIVFYVLSLFKRIIMLCGRVVCAMVKSFPLLLNTMICFCGLCILEFIGVCLYVRELEGVFLWAVEKVILLFLVVYVVLMCKRLLGGSEALAEGRQEEIVDTTYLFGSFRECAENLNSIGQGISRAVAERMKSERLKTELITNVSHDLKTPLTSIINYANLIAEEPSENEKITEYSEVLVRQSGRLKKLLEDLLEASKATTGNLEVDLKPCEVNVILAQALGEYQQKMEEKQLELIVTQPEETLSILADGRHLWRVFDNLLNNICKYAREDSRVYLSVEQKEGTVAIIFRNMSKYALNISAEELQERFVRGDKSRHKEGNGLGLSIAKSLTELQNGRMDIVTDGDLFKVSLKFTKL